MCGTVARRAAEREGINMPVQGSAADITKVARLRVHTTRRSLARRSGCSTDKRKVASSAYAERLSIRCTPYS
jgi:DNA polymerase I-like protein with 3'-5' exonuclease and polymerase domains